jgi:hypothetical protein
MSGSYYWSKFRTLHLGMRNDLKKEFESKLANLEELYHTLKMNREYDLDKKY